MTDDQQQPEASRRFDDMFTSDESVKVPDWMRHPVPEHELTGRERLRLGWERHSGKLLGAVGLLLVVGFLGFLGTTGWRFADKVNHGEVALRSRPTAPPRQVDADGNTLGVYLDTPAEHFAEGEQAIVLPAARAAGPFSAKQVADALSGVRTALVEGRLGKDMLYGDPEAFLARLAPDARSTVTDDLAAGNNLGYATRILRDANPGFVPDIRARGTIEYTATTTDDGIRVLAVTTRFIWVYSFDLFQAQKYPPGAELVTVRDEVVWHVPHPDDVRASSRGLWIGSAQVTVSNSTCAAMEKGYLALEYDPANVVLPRPGATGDIYDPGWRAGDGESC
ncbi:hypothetical protein ONA91_03045 [Micromonospora sp. DR5-3]|uniref:hypothetical protein n=1 Tax=unclassified Micromonospora TaxID=2617518 RepID=UPI0011DAE575|nr:MULTISPECIES: hypothetical protein [unclassified Micromonospora]MCW3813436.1 hypothetical protein [Micromonospora sp. DR5-3]TYC24892.1 hypothetical protein FXF52_08265 [Micromonospora sp. MP36]